MTDMTTLIETLRDTADALESRMTPEELGAKLRKDYAHPLSALDRARDLLARIAEEAEAEAPGPAAR